VIPLKRWADFAASRRSTRDFLPREVSQELLDAVISDAMSAPSWSNTRPYMIGIAFGEQRERISNQLLRRWWVLARARNGGIGAKLALLFKPWAWPINDYHMPLVYPNDLSIRSRKLGKQMYEVLRVKRNDLVARDAHWARNYEFFGAPVEIFLFAHKALGAYAVSDVSLFAQNLMLSAHAHGLATCAQGAVAMWSKPIKREFDLPKEYQLVYGIALGYRSYDKINTFKAERLPISEIIAKPKSPRS
jgi:nitroreductase